MSARHRREPARREESARGRQASVLLIVIVLLAGLAVWIFTAGPAKAAGTADTPDLLQLDGGAPETVYRLTPGQTAFWPLRLTVQSDLVSSLAALVRSAEPGGRV